MKSIAKNFRNLVAKIFWNEVSKKRRIRRGESPSPSPSITHPHFGFGFAAPNKESLSLPRAFAFGSRTRSAAVSSTRKEHSVDIIVASLTCFVAGYYGAAYVRRIASQWLASRRTRASSCTSIVVRTR